MATSTSPPLFPTETVTLQCVDTPVTFSYLMLVNSAWIWVGPASNGPTACMPNLTVGLSMNGPASASTLFGDSATAVAETMTRRLATRFPGVQVFLTVALDQTDEMVLAWVEKKIRDRLAAAVDAPSSEVCNS
ncbi:hypothetical protein BC828DRAFT_376978 [Blastocladiella britannica]|nr:hypothetical protein BC828DRAFT_376978 [Blastocladiella britannica]